MSEYKGLTLNISILCVSSLAYTKTFMANGN